jgi:hypothetical protein
MAVRFWLHLHNADERTEGGFSMVSVHMWVGTAVLVAYLTLTVANFLQYRRGTTISWARELSMGAALLLLVQIVLGFNLLASDHTITPLHYLFALAALIPVGVEHGMVKGKELATDRARLATFATAGTTLLVLVAYAIAESR